MTVDLIPVRGILCLNSSFTLPGRFCEEEWSSSTFQVGTDTNHVCFLCWCQLFESPICFAFNSGVPDDDLFRKAQAQRAIQKARSAIFVLHCGYVNLEASGLLKVLEKEPCESHTFLYGGFCTQHVLTLSSNCIRAAIINGLLSGNHALLHVHCPEKNSEYGWTAMDLNDGPSAFDNCVEV